MAVQYTRAVDYKFNKDGTFKEFLGATIVSHLDVYSQLYAEVESVSAKAQREIYAHKFAFLPPPSYHMTNFVLYNDHQSDRKAAGWSTKIKRDAPCKYINQQLYEMLSTVEFPQSYKMKLKSLRDNSLRLLPANQETENTLKKFRDDCAEATGIRFPDHDTYEFHISYAYRIIELDTQEEKKLQTFLKMETERLISVLPEFDIPAPEYCTFEDMSHFEPYKKSDKK